RQALAALPALAVPPAPAPPSPAATSASTASSAPLCVSPMAQPAPYSGSAVDCNGFILQCSLVLEMQPHLYPTERSKVAFIISQLCGQALLWAESLWSQNSPVTQSYDGFVDHFKEVFGKPSWDSSVGEELCRLQQGKLTVPEYALQFRTLAAKSGWNEQALLAAYCQGLNPQVRLHLAAYEDTIGLEWLIQLSICVAARMQSCVTEPQDQSPHSTWRDRPTPVSSPEPAPEPMHLGASHLTPAERQRRLTRNLCLYCGAPGHALPECPIRPPRPMWRHWLEGAKHPFTVLTDHKNLEYLRAAKRLNPRQALWALFFTRFNFTISYRPGSKNTKADALSQMFAPEESSETPKPILPENIFVSPITWSEETLPPTSTSTYTPPGCPPGSQYIPRARRTTLIHSAHTSLGTGHPGIHETLSLLKKRFWWPNMTVDVRRYVQGCEGCAMSKDPRHLPAGKLLPLPVPSRPWSHLGVDFVTDLPTSREHTCILVVVDRFSKSCRLLPLRGPPTALETAELLLNHVFRYFGIPEDIVSDRGPQFISRVWRAFLTCLGVAVSLSSGYHPQTNGQTERKI
ncbi:hypothetical protein QTP70_015261, partial [Hemibagrus guttatus]